MKRLDFEPEKSTSEFRKNYKLHDLAVHHGKNLFVQWGISFEEFGKDRRFEKVWEKGGDKPDDIVRYKDRFALVDWKGKRKTGWLVNKRALDAYNNWSQELKMPVIICFFIFSNDNNLIDKRFAYLDKHSYIESPNKQWDKNVTVEFDNDLPELTKGNLIKYLLHHK